jgi:hypothetical protein
MEAMRHVVTEYQGYAVAALRFWSGRASAHRRDFGFSVFSPASSSDNCADRLGKIQALTILES